MPRRARIDAPGALHHVICRGIERRKIFWEDSDRDDFLNRLETILSETQTPCYAWALMPNHFLLRLRTGNTPIARVMRQLLSGYAGRFNRLHRRAGHLFQNRYKSIICHWAIRSLGMTAVAVSKLLGISQSAATRAAYRGEAIAAADSLELIERQNA